MRTTLSSKILRVAAAAPIVLSLAACSSNNSPPPATDAGSSTTTGTTSGTSSSSGSATTTTSATSNSTTSTSSSSAITDGGAPDTGADAAPPTFAQLYSDLLHNCGGCHGLISDGGPGNGLAFGMLDLGDASAAWAGLVGADGGGVVAAGVACSALGIDAGVKRVFPGDFTKSLLCNKLVSNDGDGGSLTLSDGGREVWCGSPMPFHLPAVSPAQINEVKAWIEAGAKP